MVPVQAQFYFELPTVLTLRASGAAIQKIAVQTTRHNAWGLHAPGNGAKRDSGYWDRAIKIDWRDETQPSDEGA